MIRDPKTQSFKINVMLKSGEYFEGKDITSNPFGNYERVVSFWIGNVVRAYPIGEIEYYELVQEK